MSEHTPGPWKAVDNRTVRTVDETHKKGGLIIADVAGHSADNTKANARLIAAAPDLLAMLELMVELSVKPRCFLNNAVIDRAEATIAKATD